MLQKSLIDSSSEEGLKPSEVNGMIEFKNVTFCYPSREEVPVISTFCFLLYVIFSEMCHFLQILSLFIEL